MPNIASALKAEITRLSRKESRAATEGLKKAAAAHRADIAALKKQCLALERALKSLSKSARGASPAARGDGGLAEDQGPLRFRAQGLASHRKRLGLSAAEAGRLIGVSGQSIYLWESGRAKPRPKQMAAIDALRKMGKREAVARLQAAGASA